MAFKNIGAWVYLPAGATAMWNYSFGTGTDMGPQFACADIKFYGHWHGASPVYLADNQRKQLQKDGGATYFVNVTNQSQYGGFHNLQGGGLT
jgi:hypothetical protein